MITSSTSRPTRASVDTSALRWNLSTLRSRVGSRVRTMAVVKANCYGHGSEICVPVLRREGIDTFGVATLFEASRVRELAPDARIILLTTPFESERVLIAELGVEPLVSDRETARWLAATAESIGRSLPVHLYVDTGMTRNGVEPERALDLAHAIRRQPGLELRGIGSHLATSESHDRTYAERQISIFRATVASLADQGISPPDIHLANSGGILNYPESHGTLVRPGISLYGYHPNRTDQADSALRPVLSLTTALSSIRRVPAGTAVSYGCRWHAARDTYVGTVPIGYGDGIIRGLSGKMEVLIAGRRFPVVGTICMDEIMIDLGPDSNFEISDDVVVLGVSNGESLDAWDMAALIDSIPYEITTHLTDRVPRVAAETPEVPVEVTSPTPSTTIR